MREVWKEIGRRCGGAGRRGPYVHPARQVRTHPRFQVVVNISKQPDARDRAQEQASALLFLDVAGILLHDRRINWGPRTWTQAEVKQEISELNELAKQHEYQAEAYDRLGFWRDARALRELAANCRKEAELRRPHPHDPWIVERRSNRCGNDWDRGAIIEIECACLRLFGKPLFGTVATLSNVVLGRDDITKGVVQGVVAHLSGAAVGPAARLKRPPRSRTAAPTQRCVEASWNSSIARPRPT
jgi:hypothetical protein